MGDKSPRSRDKAKKQNSKKKADKKSARDKKQTSTMPLLAKG